jgi:uncharacterized membrane protein
MSGVFFSFSVSVTSGLGKLTDAAYLSAFQSINREIQNPVFLSCFMGAAILLPVSTWLHFREASREPFRWLLAATAVYIAGCMAVTFMGNIPLNNALDGFDIANASAEQIGQQRLYFEKSWNNLNMVRTLSSTASLILVIIACIRKPAA